jgi:hypothetical protein
MMTDDDLDPRLAGALRDYSRGGVRPIDATAIAQAATERTWHRRRIPGGTPVARWGTWLPVRAIRPAWLLVAAAAVVVVAVARMGLVPSFGGVGGPSSEPSPSPIPKATASPSPVATTSSSSDLTHSLVVDGVPFSVQLPAPRLGHEWEMYGSQHVSKSIAGPQGAEGVVYWAGFPDGTDADPCINAPLERWSPATVADYIASAPGTELVTAPRDVTVGGYPATYVAVVVREDAGCDPGFFYNWKAQTGGAMWGETVPCDSIRVWLVRVGDRLLFIAGETHRDLTPGVAITDAGRARLEQEIQQIVDSIRFE